VSLSVHNNPPLGLVFMLLCESVCTHYPSTGFGVHVTLWICLYTITLPWVWCSCCSVSLSVHTTPPVFGVHVTLWVCLYTITLPWVWFSCCSVSLSVHTTPLLGLVFMLPCESLCTHCPSPGFGVHVALWVCLFTLPLYWVWCSCCPVSLSLHNAPTLGLVFMLLCESVCTHYPSTGFGVHVALCLSVRNTPPLGLVFMLLCVCLYRLPLPCESVCAQYGTPPLGLVFMLFSLWFLCNVLLTIACLFDFLMPNGDIAITLRPSL
jgi:hypothetical protein